jgi:RNAse (barnase) inhibitor barstar
VSVLWFDGLLTQLDDAGIYFLPDDDIEELFEAAAVNRFPCVRVDLRDCADKTELLARIGDALKFPTHVAANFDALADALGDLRVPRLPGFVVLLENTDRLRRHAVGDFKTTMEVLQATSREWAKHQQPFWAFVALDDVEFAGLG